MRNLSLAASTCINIPESSRITCWATDLDQNVDYAASERCNADADVEVEVYKIGERREDNETSVSLFSTFSCPANLPTSNAQVISIRVILDTQQLVLIMRGGDITVLPLEDGPPDVVGTVDGGIAAAAWSPDESSLVLVTGDAKLIHMTNSFDVLSETALHPNDFGQDAPINVGWGSKQTQFHGSVGKAAATAPTKTVHTVSPDDDLQPRITWRGDGAYFAISSISPQEKHRKFRVYDRQAVLQSTSEDVPGLEHSLAWRPSGNLLAGTQRFGYDGGGAGKEGRHDVVFFERNGLRHLEFGIRVGDLGLASDTSHPDLRWGYKVEALRWSSDSNVLAVWIRTPSMDLVQLWSIGNYHWYLKQEIAAPASSQNTGHFTSVEWHPEKPLALILSTQNQIIQRTYAWETCCSPSRPPIDSGSVCVVDGSSLLLTPFRTQNVPPPMSSHPLSLRESSFPSSASRIPINTSFAFDSDALAILWECGRVEIWDLNTRLGPGKEKVMQPSLQWSSVLSSEGIQFRQVTLSSNRRVVILGAGLQGPDILHILQYGVDGQEIRKVEMPLRNGHLVASETAIIWQSLTGELLNVDSTSLTATVVASFASPCWSTKHSAVPTSNGTIQSLFIGLSESGKLQISIEGSHTSTTPLLATNATSFTIASGFLIFTTGSHDAVFAPLTVLVSWFRAENDVDRDAIKAGWEKRRMERGSRIVVSIPSAMSLVLQMPRGNLETINPRPLVMDVVKQDLDSTRYRKAFLACRKHRIDLNVIVEHDQEAFLKNVSLFVEQVEEVDYINLFLAGVGRSSQSPETIAIICDTVRIELEKKGLKKYVNSILTAHVVKTPPDHEAGLSLLLKLRDDNPELVEDAVKYIIFLVDAEKLYNTALGMYDFSLVLMIAQHAQKDPREYLPFLRELRAMEQYVQRHKIDDHLKRYDSALLNLSLAGDDHFDEAVSYIERYSLYETALGIWKDTPRYQAVLSVYGDWLFERREFRQAASAFVDAAALPKAMVAYEKALEWQSLFDLVIRTGMSEEDVVATGYRVAEDLTSKKRHLDAARVLLDYAGDVRDAVIALTQGNAFSEARRIATLHRMPELLENVIHPAALDSRAQISEDLKEMNEQLDKQFSRLLELRIKRVEEPDAFFGVEDATLQNVDVMTDVSMPYTAFTRYTVAPTATSRSSKRTSRSKRKQERKVGSGRKGTVDEEEYLVKSAVKLVGRFAISRDEARSLIPHLYEFSSEHRTEGLSLQKELDGFERKLRETIEEIWKKPIVDGDEGAGDSWRARMEEADKARKLNPIDSVPKPEFSDSADWRLRLLDLGE